MSGWRKVELTSICRITQGGRLKLSGKHFSPDANFPAYGAGGLNGWLDTCEFDRPAIVLSSIGARCGKCFLTPQHWTSLANTQLIFPMMDDVDLKFLWYQLNDEASWPRSGAAQPFIKPSDVKSRRILLPPLAEQKRIVAFLDEAFAGIAKATANTERNLTNARSLSDSIITSALSETNSGWTTSKLEDCFRLKSGDNLTSSQMIEGAYPVYGGNGIAGTHNTSNLNGDNVIVGRVGALCGNARRIVGHIWLTDNAFRVCDKEVDLHNGFLTYLLNFKKLRSLARQSAQPVISNSSLRDLPLSFPISVKEQENISERLDKMTESTSKLEEKYQAKISMLDKLKQSLLHQAFSGNLSKEAKAA